MILAQEALALLRNGNLRYVADVRSHDTLPSRARRIELAAGQEPFAAILGCSDSRVPVEIVFDQGLGDLFVIRVAGNIVAPSGIGSVEFAAVQFGTRLVVVLGHTQCGAIDAIVHPERTRHLRFVSRWLDEAGAIPRILEERYGALDPEHVVTPCLYVDRVVCVDRNLAMSGDTR